MDQEIVKIKQRYKKRRGLMGFLYSPLNPSVYLSQQEKERKFIDWVRTEGIQPLKDKKMLEIGCGYGINLLQMMKLGFLPENLVGNELLEERVENAKKFLPSSIRIYPGDATELNFQENSFDVVLQSTVFSSILDDECQQKLADKMWFFTKSGGGVLWYDFI